MKELKACCISQDVNKKIIKRGKVDGAKWNKVTLMIIIKFNYAQSVPLSGKKDLNSTSAFYNRFRTKL